MPHTDFKKSHFKHLSDSKNAYDLFQVLEKLEKTRVLAERGATDGERAAGVAAVERLRVRLMQFRAKTNTPAKADDYTFTMDITSLAEMRIAHKLLAEKGGRVLSFVRNPSGLLTVRSLTAVVPYREDALTIQTLTQWYCEELDEQLSTLAREFVHGAKQSLVKLDTYAAVRGTDADAKDLAWRLPSKHERNVFGTIAKACGKDAFRVASDAKSVMKINAHSESEASHLLALFNDLMARFTRAMLSLSHGYLQGIGAH